MDRRTALKNLTKSIGFAVATPTVMSVLASCSQEPKASWVAQFLSDEEKHMVTHLVDIIIPKDDIVGALDVNIPQFIDLMYHEVETKQNQQLFRQGAKSLSENFIQTLHKDISAGTKEDFTVLLNNYFNLSEYETKTILKEQKLNPNNISKGKIELYSLYKFLLSVRYYTIFGYVTSKKVGEEVLAYDPTPGVYNGCISLEEATNGRAWSL